MALGSAALQRIVESRRGKQRGHSGPFEIAVPGERMAYRSKRGKASGEAQKKSRISHSPKQVQAWKASITAALENGGYGLKDLNALKILQENHASLAASAKDGVALRHWVAAKAVSDYIASLRQGKRQK